MDYQTKAGKVIAPVVGMAERISGQPERILKKKLWKLLDDNFRSGNYCFDDSMDAVCQEFDRLLDGLGFSGAQILMIIDELESLLIVNFE